MWDQEKNDRKLASLNARKLEGLKALASQFIADRESLKMGAWTAKSKKLRRREAEKGKIGKGQSA